MRILVTGGAGFIGANFVRRSASLYPEHNYVCFDSLTYAGRLENLDGLLGENSSIEFIRGDIRDRKALDSALQGVDVVVNFAAETHNDNSLTSPEIFILTNVEGTYTLLEACRSAGVRLHHVSTDEVFGDFPIDSTAKFNEETPYAPSSPYSASKASSDHFVRAWVRSFGLKATISNCSNNFGPHQHEEKLIPRTVMLASSGVKPKVYGNGANVRDWIHVDDHTDGIWAILSKGKIGETYLLGASNERTNLQLVQQILGILGLPQDFIEFVEDRPGHDRRYAIDSSKAQRELGWLPDNSLFETQLVDTVRHFEAQFKKK
jgi:dTDP-glucose 4,6-dehydratase